MSHHTTTVKTPEPTLHNARLRAMRQIVAHRDKIPKRSKRIFQKVILFRHPCIRFSSSTAGANRWDWCRRKLWDCRAYIHQFGYFSFSLHFLYVAFNKCDFFRRQPILFVELSVDIGDRSAPVDVGGRSEVLPRYVLPSVFGVMLRHL